MNGVATYTCGVCGAPVELNFDDEWQHQAVDDGLACTVWPVPARPAAFAWKEES